MEFQNSVASVGIQPYRTCPATSAVASGASTLFETIPPERMGLNGEYDYHGLTKRVCHAFCQRFGEASLTPWAIAQRGGIVTIRGRITSAYLLYQFIDLALRTEGTVGVEINGNTIFSHIDLHRMVPPPPSLAS
ncbi:MULTISPECIES: phospholipid-binding protein [unclassified Leptolyngbya]|jgi:hypothetical protein|uniref:phospholipid-binding protein n=1 Tax=unclassified Leptolyngbya TaxID=2650499 RepID=UPI0016886B69|nr:MULTISPECIES: phospholipid-binding protein [unclassified Leptolyngbya]MBD1910983.1 phospholipid-binding protein [Leptolyngbya sp. FACHB-8]MBD2158350.1 phospholipid-binding protein [Leptolyngbya sp. FACHB-16]